MLKVNILFTLMGIGGIVVTGGAIAFQKGVKKVKTWEEWVKENKQVCYKWIYYGSSTEGELLACENKNASKTAGAPALRFYLWWLKKDDKYYGRHLEIEQIKFETQGKDISFVFKDNKYNDPEKKLKIPPQRPEMKKNLESISNQPLKNICKVESSWKLSCTPSGRGTTYTAVVQFVNHWFEMKN